MMPTVLMPNSPNSHPPSTPPIIPTIRLTIRPNPPPRISFPATKPDKTPMSMYHKKFIICSYFKS